MNISRLKFDIDKLVNEILDHIPEEMFSRDDTTFLDPEMGGGQFVKEVEKRLRSYGHSNDNISSRVTGFTSSRIQLNYVVRKHKLLGQYSIFNIMENSPSKKFDVVIGNPPFQDIVSPGKKIWKNFYKISFHLLQEDGIISLISPSSFIKRNGKSMDWLRKYFNDRDIVHIDSTINKYFQIGEDVLYCVVKNSKKNIKTSVKHKDGLEVQDLSQNILNISFGKNDKIFRSIIKKMSDPKINRIKIREDIHDCQPQMIKDGRLSEIKDDNYKYEVIYSPAKKHYSPSLFGDRDHLRLMITMAGAYYDEINPDKNIFISNSHSGQGMFHILISSKEEGLRIKKVLTSKIYRFFVNSQKTSGFNTTVGQLPEVDFSRSWTDQELYDHFNLTQEEIDYIEANV